MNIPIKGKIDLSTLSRMSWKRCGNSDRPITGIIIFQIKFKIKFYRTSHLGANFT